MPISKKAIKNRQRIFKGLQKLHPGATIELKFKNPLQLLVAVVLSAQANDKTVNAVTKTLFKKYKTVNDYARTTPEKLDKDIAKINFHKNKAKSIVGAARMIKEKFGGRVPDKMEDLVKLPGVGRKTANVILGHAFNKAEGIVVDTHVKRVAQRIGWTKNTDPIKIEADLMKLFPRSQWVKLGDVLVLHGRYICKAKNPKCQNCPFEAFCPGQKRVT